MYFITKELNVAQDVAEHNVNKTKPFKHNDFWVVEVDENNKYSKIANGRIVEGYINND